MGLSYRNQVTIENYYRENYQTNNYMLHAEKKNRFLLADAQMTFITYYRVERQDKVNIVNIKQ